MMRTLGFAAANCNDKKHRLKQQRVISAYENKFKRNERGANYERV